MKIATFNINNINKRLPNLLAWLGAAQPDVVCLQELKAGDAEFPKAAIEQAGYGAVWCGQKSWNGVAILARGCEPIVTRTGLPGDAADAQSRYIEAAVNGRTGRLALCAERQPAARSEIRIQARLDGAARSACARSSIGADVPGRAGGRLQCRPDRPGHLSDQILREGRAAAARNRARYSASFSIRAGSTRSARCHPDAPMYTFWDYMRNRWPRDAGLRLDHLLLSARSGEAARWMPASIATCAAKEGASDHAPAWVVLARCRRQPSSKGNQTGTSQRARLAETAPPPPASENCSRGRCW